MGDDLQQLGWVRPSGAARGPAIDDRVARPPACAWPVVPARVGQRAPRDRGHRVSTRRPGRAPPRRRGHLLGGAVVMDVTLWGTRGSLASPGPETARHGGSSAADGGRAWILG